MNSSVSTCGMIICCVRIRLFDDRTDFASTEYVVNCSVSTCGIIIRCFRIKLFEDRDLRALRRLVNSGVSTCGVITCCFRIRLFDDYRDLRALRRL